MLTVKQFKASRTRATEASFEKAFAARLTNAGVYSRHMSDAIPGLPDRYIRGGMWIEFKSLFRKRGEFTHGEELSPEQKATLKALHEAGDRCFYCALLDTGVGGKAFVFEPWSVCAGLMGELITPMQTWFYDRAAMDRVIERDLRRA